jgi:hypothetical protein
MGKTIHVNKALDRLFSCCFVSTRDWRILHSLRQHCPLNTVYLFLITNRIINTKKLHTHLAMARVIGINQLNPIKASDPVIPKKC